MHFVMKIKMIIYLSVCLCHFFRQRACFHKWLLCLPTDATLSLPTIRGVCGQPIFCSSNGHFHIKLIPAQTGNRIIDIFCQLIITDLRRGKTCFSDKDKLNKIIEMNKIIKMIRIIKIIKIIWIIKYSKK